MLLGRRARGSKGFGLRAARSVPEALKTHRNWWSLQELIENAAEVTQKNADLMNPLQLACVTRRQGLGFRVYDFHAALSNLGLYKKHFQPLPTC